MNEFEQLKAAFPESEPGADARRKARALMSAQVARNRHTRRTRLATLSFAGTAALVAAGVLIGPAAIASYHIRQIHGATERVSSATMTAYFVDDRGRKALSSQMSYQNGRWRIEQPTRVQIFADGTNWFYSKDKNQVIVQRNKKGPFTHNPTGFTLDDMIRDETNWGRAFKTDYSSSNESGRPVETVTLTDDMQGRTIMKADGNSHLPFEIQIMQSMASGWKLTMLIDLDYNRKLDAGLFKPTFPGASFVDEEDSKEQWRRQLNKPIAVLDTKPKIQIRFVYTNEHGDVYILFTDGETSADRQHYADLMLSGKPVGEDLFPLEYLQNHFGLTGSNGEEYAAGSDFQPYMGGRTESEVKGIVLADGEVLEGLSFVPLSEEPWRSKTVHLSFYGNEVWSSKLDRPSGELVPAWMSLMAMAPANETVLGIGERDVRLQPLVNAGRWKEVEKLIRTDLQELPKQHYQINANRYFYLYRALIEQGRHNEAVDVLRHAEVPTGDAFESAIETAKRREGIH